MPISSTNTTLSINFKSASEANDTISLAIKHLSDIKKNTINHISFYNSAMNHIESEKLFELFDIANSHGVISLSFENTCLEQAAKEVFNAIIRACSSGSIREIDLTRNAFGDGEIEQKVISLNFIKKLANHITTMNLSLNQLEYCSLEELKDLFKAFANSQTLHDLDLSYNGFCEIQGFSVKTLLPLFTGNLINLSLRLTGLHVLTIQEWDALKQAIEKSCICKLNLSHNELMDCSLLLKDKESLIVILQQLSKIPQLNIDLSENNLPYLLTESNFQPLLKQYKMTLPTSISQANSLKEGIIHQSHTVGHKLILT